MCLLAVSDSAVFVMWGAQIAVTIMLGILTAWLGSKVRRWEKMEDRITEMAREAVEQQIEHHAEQVSQMFRAVADNIGSCVKRLDQGESELKASIRSAFELEMRSVRGAGEMKDEMREYIDRRCVTKEQFSEVKDDIAGLGRRFDEVAKYIEHRRN